MTLAVYPITSKPNTAEALPGTATASSTYITMTSSASTASVNLTPRDSSGTFAESDTASTAMFSIATNNVSGYELSIAGSDSTYQELKNTATSTTLVSIDTIIDSSTFSNENNTIYNGKWGYKPSKYNSTTNVGFLPAPAPKDDQTEDGGDTLDKTAIANTKKSTATGDTVNCTNYDCNEYTIALGARADMGVKAGTYTNTFILTAVGNPVTYSITYADNSGDSTVSNLPARQYSDQGITATSINLSSTIPTRTNYTFLKWCLGTNSQSAAEVVTSSGTICNGTSYNAGSSFGIDQTTLNNSTLYAVWSPNITIKTSTGINTTTLNGTETSTTTGTTITGLINGQSYNLSTTTATGYSFSSWPTLSANEGTITNSSTSGSTTTATYIVGSLPVTITPTATANKYNITLTNTNATTSGSTAAYTTYNSSSVYNGSAASAGTTTITAPQRSYTVSGFDTSYNNASGASVSSTAAKTYTYAFNGWYTATSGGNRIITSTGTLVASTSYTNASSQWTYHTTSNPALTLYAQWGSGTSITLPTISKTGHTCGWTTSTSTSSITYASGYSGLVPTANMTLHGVCTLNSYTITLTRNNASAIVIDGTSQTGSSINLTYGTHTISGTYPSGYEFSSWETSGSISVSSTSAASTTLTVSGTGTLTLNGKVSMLAMQDITSSTCTTTAQTVYDNRDNQQYLIQKLADGKCWMLDNLRLGVTDISTNLTSDNTNLSSAISASTWNGYRTTSGFTSYIAPMFNSASANNTTTSYGSGSGKIGVYYNYCAASAGTYCYASGSGTGNASYDICPKGWRMPTGGPDGEYQALYTAYSSNTTNFKTALSTPLSGYFYNSSAGSQGSLGYFWSSTYGDGNDMYLLLVDSSSVFPTSDRSRDYGRSVRCLLETRTPFEKLQAGVLSMQDIGNLSSDEKSTLVSQMTTGTSYNVSDSRDGESYKIAKLADGRVWLQDNLRLGSTSTISLSSSDTNIASNWTLPASSSSRFSSYDTAMINTASKDTTTTSYGSGSGKIGVYYNYCAASAGTYCMPSGEGSGNASYDICPKGWRMPTGGSSGEYQALYTAYSSNATNFKTALSTPLSGYFSDSSARNQGSRGSFRSSTYHSSSSMYSLLVVSSAVSLTDYYERYYGLSVRCLLK